MDFDAADVVAAKTTIRRGRIRGEEKNIRATSLPVSLHVYLQERSEITCSLVHSNNLSCIDG